MSNSTDPSAKDYDPRPKVVPGSDGACAFRGCCNIGAMTPSTTGTEKWYCKEHFWGTGRQDTQRFTPPNDF